MIILIGSIVLGVVIYSLLCKLSVVFEEPKTYALKRNIGVSGITALVNILAPKVPAAVAMLLLIVMIITMGYMVYWWGKEGSNFKELAMFIVVDLLMVLVANAAAIKITDITNVKWVIVFISSLPLIAVVMSVGLFVTDMLYFREILEGGGDQDEEEHGFGNNGNNGRNDEVLEA